jgi:hypothetical protein
VLNGAGLFALRHEIGMEIQDGMFHASLIKASR